MDSVAQRYLKNENQPDFQFSLKMEQKFIESHKNKIIVRSVGGVHDFKAPSQEVKGGVLYALNPDENIYRNVDFLEMVHFPFTEHFFSTEDAIKEYLERLYPYRTLYYTQFQKELSGTHLEFFTKFVHILILGKTCFFSVDTCPDMNIGFIRVLNGSGDGEVNVLQRGWDTIREGTLLPKREPLTCAQAFATFFQTIIRKVYKRSFQGVLNLVRILQRVSYFLKVLRREQPS